MPTKSKKTRKHQGIIQSGGNKGKLKKGYKYSGKKLKSGLPQILKVTKKKNKSQRGGFKAAWQQEKYNDDFTTLLARKNNVPPPRIGKWEWSESGTKHKYIAKGTENTIVYHQHPHYQNITITYVRDHKNRKKNPSRMITDSFYNIPRNHLRDRVRNENLWDIHATETRYDNYGNERMPKLHVYGVNNSDDNHPHSNGILIYVPGAWNYGNARKVEFDNISNALVDFINNLDQYIHNFVANSKLSFS